MVTILCIDNDPLMPQVVSAQLAKAALDCPIALATTVQGAIAQIDAIAATASEAPLVIAHQALIDPLWLQTLYTRFPQALLVVLAASSVEAIEALVPSGQLYRCLPPAWQPAELRLTLVEARRRYRHEQQLAQMQVALTAALKDGEAHPKTHHGMALELTNTGSWELDVATGAMLWSQSHYRLMGLSPTDQPVTYATWRDAVHPDDVAQVEGAFAQAMATGTLLDLEYRVVLPDGTVRWVMTRGHGLYDNRGRPLKMLGVMVDIGDRKRIEDFLKQSQEQLQIALEFGHMAIWTWDLLSDHLIWNDIAYRLLGLEPSPEPLTYADWLQAVHPQDRASVQLEIDRANAERRPFALEYRVLWPDGTERWIADNGQSVYAADGRELRAAGIMYDITERKTAQLALQDSEARFRQLAETVREGFFVFDVAHRCYEYMNPANASLADTEALAHQGMAYWLNNIHPDDRDRVAAAAQQQFQGVPFDEEYRLWGPDGELHWVRSQGYPVRGEDGTIVRVVGITEDIGERKRDEAERKRAELALHQLNGELEQRVQQRTQELQKLAAIVENSTEFVGTASLSGEVLYINRSGRQLVGLSAEEAVDGAAIADFHSAATVARLMQEVLPIARRQGYWRGESTLRHWQTGEDIAVEQVIFLIRDAHTQEPLCMGTTCRDIRDRKRDEAKRQQSELALRQAQESLEIALEAAQMGTWYVDLTQDVALRSLRHDQLFGYATPVETWSQALTRQHVVAADQPRFDAAFAHALATGDLSFEGRVQWPDGSIHWMALCGRVYCDDNGTPLYSGGVNFDISDRKQAEINLQESEARFRQITETIQEVFWMTTADSSQTLYVSPAFERVWGISCEALYQSIGVLAEAIHPDDLAEVEAALHPDRIHDYDQVYRIRRADGETRWIHDRAFPVLNERGEVYRIVGVANDITDRKQAEQAEQDSRTMLQLVLDTIPQRVFWKDRNSIYLGCNLAFAQDLNLTPDQVVGKTDSDLPFIVNACRYRAEDAQIVSSQTPGLGYEERLPSPDPEIERWARTSKVPLTDNDGEVIGVLGCYEDITDYRQAEMQLREQEQFLRSIYEGVNQPVCVSEVAEDGTVRLVGLNPAAARLFGTTSAPVAGKSLEEAFGAQEAAEILQRYRHCIATSQPLTFERSLTVAGKTHWLLGTYNPIVNPEGRVYRIVGSLYDISDRKRAEAALQQLNAELEQRVQERTQALQQAMETAQSASRAKSTFLANMSHELRTPLNAILGFAQLMARDTALGSGNRQSLEIINRSGEHLLELINDILEMAKIEAGQVRLNPLCFDLDKLLTTLGDMFCVRAQGKGLTLAIDRHPALPRYLRSDEPKLRQVLINLVGNAIKFTAQGQVCLRLAPVEPIPVGLRPGAGLSIAFTVSDTGIGIAAEHLDGLFAPFVQVNQGAGVFEGTGLGLSISHQFVQLLGGTLTVASQPGAGSTFTFTLPMQVAAGVEETDPVLPSAQIAELAPGQPSYRILVVDDDDTHRQLLTQLLSAVGFGVSEARDGQEAIALWERWHPQLIWLDIRMPTLTGCDLARHIRAQERANDLPPTKLIALTANAFEEDRAQALAVGCDDFVRKPFQLGYVLAKLAEHLGVQYTYSPESPVVTAAPLAAADAIAALGTLSPQIRRQLHHATLQLDSELITQLIDQLPPSHRPLANLLHQHLDNFAFDTIHDLLQQIPNP
ncbi:PAS domain-containing protein [Nodosilinea sp. PGN35]|uniref:PAS domain-containing protein n=1 Tax=Nodosilinea sp. PGN35 TaxID=3020489 RepID=UPI0023B2550F|nr:PAS domain-containing protein [Nodosilinea sp. TSF1-S3]MDF0366209.1 PAS domain-containing protein [Nodosilinea sp. TSF1-S3]